MQVRPGRRHPTAAAESSDVGLGEKELVWASISSAQSVTLLNADYEVRTYCIAYCITCRRVHDVVMGCWKTALRQRKNFGVRVGKGEGLEGVDIRVCARPALHDSHTPTLLAPNSRSQHVPDGLKCEASEKARGSADPKSICPLLPFAFLVALL